MLPERAIALFAHDGRVGMALMSADTVAGRARGPVAISSADGPLVLEAMFGPYGGPVAYDGLGLFLDGELVELAPLGDTMRLVAGTELTQQVSYDVMTVLGDG